MRYRRPRRKMALLLGAFLVFAGIIGALILRKYEMSRMKPAPPLQAQEAGTLLVTLFFSSADGKRLVREAREIDACSDPAVCSEEVLDELVNGPLGETGPTLPPTAAVRSVTMQGDTAVVDLSKETVEGLPDGRNSQILAVYSIVDSLAVNFSQIKKVKFLLEGVNVSSLGHVDVGAPLVPDFSLENEK